MPPTKTPTSSLSGSHTTYFLSLHLTIITATAIELLIKRIRYRTLVNIRRMFSGGVSPVTPTTRSSSFTMLPQEIVEMIIAHLVYHKRSSIACSLTCHSWYIIAVRHLHHTLITEYLRPPIDPRLLWPKPLREASKLGLLPLVKEFHFHIDLPCYYRPRKLSPKQLNYCTLRHFSALTNVQELELDYLDIPSFIPRIQRYFGHFLPTVRSLALREPKGSRRQILYFIGLFQHLDNLKLLYRTLYFREGPTDDLTLIPLFAPPLRGRLTMTRFGGVGLFKDMIQLFGGIRFRYMDLFEVGGMRFLLGACVKTLETLRLYPTDPRAGTSLRDFDLSRNESLRTLEITAHHLDCALEADSPNTTPCLLTYALSTITSPAFSEVIVYHWDYDFRGTGYLWQPPTFQPSPHHQRLKALRRMHKIREFKLVLCADVWDGVGKSSVEMLKQAVAAEKERGVFDDIFQEPSVIYSPRGFRNWIQVHSPGCTYPWIPL
ncbi:hypothetical protein BDM02DRAFT_3190142 [Thelephora ganbajun]|uniref:Uncharacterized protein n=1 Tax=Thelephora ganbajun TaxID=370292 RepID=A0ACB6Z5T7_THEGA|nr:hypothetical protein BDM02DRAFT_3190142 [Thelephora ganbajun]